MASSSDVLSSRGFSVERLSKALFQMELSEEYIRSLPPLTIQFVLLRNGLDSSLDLIKALTNEQLRAVLDYNLFRKDEIDENSLFELISLTDEDSGLTVLQKIVRNLDLKLVAFMIGKYVESVTTPERTDAPPEKGFYTPDEGYTWIRVNTDSENRNFLLSRLLALLFETNSDLFYQLLATPSVATLSVLQEEAYTDRTKRMESEGFPSFEYAAEFFEVSSWDELLEKSSDPRHEMDVIHPVELPLYSGGQLQPLNGLLEVVRNKELFAQEFTLLLNAALVRMGSDYTDNDALWLVGNKVKGVLNIGLEELLNRSRRSAEDIYNSGGLRIFFKAGNKILEEEIRRPALKISRNRNREHDEWAKLILEKASRIFPHTVEFALSSRPAVDLLTELPTTEVPLQSRKDLDSLNEWFGFIDSQAYDK